MYTVKQSSVTKTHGLQKSLFHMQLRTTASEYINVHVGNV